VASPLSAQFLLNLDSPTGAKSHLAGNQETWVRNMAAEFCFQDIFHAFKDLLHVASLRHGTESFITVRPET
jgi:hypothetical protein